MLLTFRRRRKRLKNPPFRFYVKLLSLENTDTKFHLSVVGRIFYPTPGNAHAIFICVGVSAFSSHIRPKYVAHTSARFGIMPGDSKALKDLGVSLFLRNFFFLSRFWRVSWGEPRAFLRVV